MYNLNLQTDDKDYAVGLMEEITRDIKDDVVDGNSSCSLHKVEGNENDYECVIYNYASKIDNFKCCDCECCEEEYNLKGLGFGIAFDFLTENPEFGMRLPCWGKDRVIRIQIPDENSFMTHPYLYIETEHENIPFVVDYMSLFSNEWEIVE